MMTTEYRSFEEIDQRLKVLKLQREIDQESLKLHFRHAKIDVLPHKMLGGLGTTLTQNGTLKSMLIAYIVKKMLGILKKKRKKEVDV